MVKSKIVISTEGWNQNETTAFVILLFFFRKIRITFESTQFTYRGKILLQKNKRYVERVRARKTEGDKDAVDVRKKIKESRRQRGAEHPCDGPRALPGLSADRKPEIENGRRARD